MARIQRIPIDSGEPRPFKDGKGYLDVGETASGAVGRAVFEPGWKWSEHVKPIAGTDSCQAGHMGFVVSGQMRVVMDDGTAADYGPGDVMIAPPGHDAWVPGTEPCVVIDWQGVADYAKPCPTAASAAGLAAVAHASTSDNRVRRSSRSDASSAPSAD